jgi:hypothetical protein
MSDYEALMNIESIKQLNACYFRIVDLTAGMISRTCLPADATFDLGDGIRRRGRRVSPRVRT